MINKIRILEESFNLIKNKKKTIEGRLYKGFFQTLKIDDDLYIECVKTQEIIKVKIKNIVKYASFRDMFNKINIKDICPTEICIDSSIKRYRNFYSFEQETKYKVIAIYI